MAERLRVTLELGPKGKRVVAVAPDWPGLERGAPTGDAAVARLRSYLPRYAGVAELVGMSAAFARVGDVEVVEEYPRDRDVIVRHVFATEREWADKVGVRVLPSPVVPDEKAYRTHRDAYGAAIRQHHAEGRMARTWPLRFLVRHTAYHAMDHAWEMEDKDLTTTGRAAGPAPRRGGARR